MSTILSLVEAVRAIRHGRVTARELVEQCLARIDRYDAEVRAWVVVDRQQALATARLQDEEAARGQFRGPLHGIPLGIKDIIDVAGLPTEAGSPLRRGQIAATDAPVVAALRQAGAIFLGKTITVQFACFDPSPTRNPWNLAHTPGGSSSGSAAALALGMCLGSVGTQTGGSLVRPASYCGIATLKPTFGRISREGVVPVSRHLDHVGPMARTVADLAVLYHAILDQTDADRPACLSGRQPPRLGFLEQTVLETAEPPVRQATLAAVERLRRGGAIVERVEVPKEFFEVLPMHRRIMAVEAATYHREAFAAHRQEYGPMITTLLDEGLEIRGVDFAAALQWRRDFARIAARLVGAFDALVMPSTHTTAPATLTTTGTPHFQAPWSMARLPVVGIPSGIADAAMPAALQFIGRANEEDPLLDTAAWCEAHLGFAARPAMLDMD